MIVITRIVRNDKKEIAFVSPYCVFDGSMKDAKKACIDLKNNDVSWVEYFAQDVVVLGVGEI
jgi:hypothetical protein